MIAEKTVFILGAGASCPYGFPSGARLRKLICHNAGFIERHLEYRKVNQCEDKQKADIQNFIKIFDRSHIRSIDMFMANNPKLAPVGKYIIAFEILTAEQHTQFGEKADQAREIYSQPLEVTPSRNFLRRGTYQGEDWYSYLYNQFIEGLAGKNTIPDFSDNKVTFITFNYDRSLEYFLYESFCNSFTEISEDKIAQSLMQLKILHVYGQVASLKWQNPNNYIDYSSQLNEPLLQRAANNIKTIYEENQNPELNEAKKLISEAKRIFFLGFSYAPENMEILGLPKIIPTETKVYGTGFGLEGNEISKFRKKIISSIYAKFPENGRIGLLPIIEMQVKLENMDCLKLLRNYLE